MSRFIITTGPLANPCDSEILAAAGRDLMHWSECQDEGVILDREFFATRAEAEANASKKSGFDPSADMEFHYEARSMWLDEDGDLVAAESEDEMPPATSVTVTISKITLDPASDLYEAEWFGDQIAIGDEALRLGYKVEGVYNPQGKAAGDNVFEGTLHLSKA
jgi:hypothetical protein